MSEGLTGIFVRIKRDGQFKNLDVGGLTDDELEGFFAEVNVGVARRWAIALAKWIRDNEPGEDPTK